MWDRPQFPENFIDNTNEIRAFPPKKSGRETWNKCLKIPTNI